MSKKLDITKTVLVLIFIFQFYLFFEIKNSEMHYNSITTKNLKIEDDSGSVLVEINESGNIYLYDRTGKRKLIIGQVGYSENYGDRGGGIKIYNDQDSLTTFIDNRVIGIYNSKGNLSASIGRDMFNYGFIALFDSLGKTYFVKTHNK